MIDAIKKIQLQKLLALGALVILYVFFSVYGPLVMGRNFITMPIVLNILTSSYFIGFMAIGVTFVIITGGIDLSIGAVMICSALVGGELYRIHGLPLWMCLLAMILFATMFGLINGLLVTRLKLPPFVATLGTMLVSLGLGSIITNVQSRVFPTTVAGPDGWFREVFLRTEGNFPTGAVFLGLYMVIAIIVLSKTKLGRYIFAIGSNEEAVRLSGVKAQNWKCAAYVISGLSAGLGAIFYAAAYTTITPGRGQGYELQAIAAVVIGGTSLAGGVGSITGTIIGVFIMSVLRVGLVSMDLPAPFQTFFTGLVLVGAVLLDIYRNQRANRVKKVS